MYVCVCVYVCFKISVSSEGTGADDAELDQHRFYDGQNSGQWNSTSRPLPSVFCTRGLTLDTLRLHIRTHLFSYSYTFNLCI